MSTSDWSLLTDDELRGGIRLARHRIDSAERTLKALMAESARRFGPVDHEPSDS